MLGNCPGEQAVADLLLGRGAPGDQLEHIARDPAIVAILMEDPAGNHADRLPGARRIGQTIDQQQTQILLRREQLARAFVGTRRDHDFGEDMADRLCRGAVQRPVDRDNPAERRDAVTGERRIPGGAQAVAARHAARIGMLDDDDRRRSVAKFGDKLERRIGVGEVVIAELLALNLLSLRDPTGMGPRRDIERGLLMRVFAITQRHHQPARHRPQRREFLPEVDAGKPCRDRRIIAGRCRERLGRQRLA